MKDDDDDDGRGGREGDPGQEEEEEDDDKEIAAAREGSSSFVSHPLVLHTRPQELTVEEFIERFERPRLPVVITGLVDTWRSEEGGEEGGEESKGGEDRSLRHDHSEHAAAGALGGDRAGHSNGLRESGAGLPPSPPAPGRQQQPPYLRWSVDSLLERFGSHRFKVGLSFL